MVRFTSRVVRSGIIYLVGVGLIAIACGRYDNKAGLRAPKPSDKSDKARNTVYVESVEAPESVLQSGQLEVRVSGNLPSPAYSFARFNVDVSDRVITITPIADYDESLLTTQVLVPFERVCIVKDLQPGSYAVRVVGRGGHVPSRQVQVTAGK